MAQLKREEQARRYGAEQEEAARREAMMRALAVAKQASAEAEARCEARAARRRQRWEQEDKAALLEGPEATASCWAAAEGRGGGVAASGHGHSLR